MRDNLPSQLHVIKNAFQGNQILFGHADALAHLAAVRGPVTDVVLRLMVVPADQVQLALPAAGAGGKNSRTVIY